MVNVFANGFVVDEECVRGMVEEVIYSHKVSVNWEVNVNFVARSEMLKLHDKQPHEVLAFPLDKEVGPDGVSRLGDIVVLGRLPAKKLDALVKHACLHLLGIHHC